MKKVRNIVNIVKIILSILFTYGVLFSITAIKIAIALIKKTYNVLKKVKLGKIYA